MIYFWYKFIHLGSLVLWAGPAIGAYWLLMHVENKAEPLYLWEKYYEQVLVIEHVAFVSLLISGWLLWREMGVSIQEIPWLHWKLCLVVVILAVEMFDVTLSHIYFRKVTRGGRISDPIQWKKFLKIRGIFYAISTPLLLVLILGTIGLAIFKPS